MSLIYVHILIFVLYCSFVYQLQLLKAHIQSQTVMNTESRPPPVVQPVVQPVIQQVIQPPPVVTTPRHPGHHPGHRSVGHLIDTATNSRYVLYGRPKDARANLWYYYTTRHSNGNMYDIVMIPIVSKSRVCMEDWGCHELYDNDVVHIQGDTTPLIVKIYNKHVFFN